ncbi:Rv3235 family protein [Kitasatospora sp. NBC_01287]|uniref:Rv3235 family protein n=1 Tax=Kitasatospora sp. NBC_01287 TaxID=2903573 RepID=UPI00225024DC|nr:Rv3235 family protein [Kitasatospora sp. NBC_01287]MCX4748718.1 Rv3235 family protein [Kitasatospora sp. NBC_01287]
MAETALRTTTAPASALAAPASAPAATTATAAAAPATGPAIRRLAAARRPAPHRAPTGRAVAPRHPRAACDDGDLAARFALRLVEVLSGLRPIGQLARHTTHDGYRLLARLAGQGPLRRPGQPQRPRLARVHESAPAAGVLEVCVRVESGERHHMVAFRLERHRRTEQWQLAAVEAR